MAKTPEGQLLKLVMDWLAAEHIFALRMNSGALRNPAGKPVTFEAPGMADVLAFPHRYAGPDPCGYSEPTWIELKAPKGKQSELQKSFQAKVESEGHRYILGRSLDDVIAVLSN